MNLIFEEIGRQSLTGGSICLCRAGSRRRYGFLGSETDTKSQRKNANKESNEQFHKVINCNVSRTTRSHFAQITINDNFF